MKTPEGVSGGNNQEGSKVEASPISASDYSKMVQDYHSITIRSVVSDPYSMYLKRNKAVEIFAAGTGEVAKGLVAMNTSFEEKSGGKTGLAAAEDPALAIIAGDNCNLQEAALNPETPPSSIIIPEVYKSRSESGKTLQERTGDFLHIFDKQGNLTENNRFLLDVKGASSSVEDKKISPENNDNDVDTSYVDMALGNIPKDISFEVKNSNAIDFTEEDTSTYKIIKQGENISSDEVKVSPEPVTSVLPETSPVQTSLDIDLTQMEANALKNAPVDIDLNTLEHDAEAVDINLTKMEHDAAKNSPILGGESILEEMKPSWETNKEVYVNNFSSEEQEAAREKWYRENAGEAAIEDAEKEARIRAREQLLELTKESQERIEKISAALEVRQNKSKGILERMGLNLASGLEMFNKLPKRTRLLLGVAFAGASVVSGIYIGGVAAIAAGAAAKGLSATFFASRFYEKGIAEAEKDAQGTDTEVKKGRIAVKSLGWGLLAMFGTSTAFSILGDVAGKTAGAIHEKGSHIIDGLRDYFAVPDVPAIPPLGEYTIQSGDNLTKIALEKVMPHISGFDSLTDLQKNNMVENMFTLAKDNPDNHLFDNIRQYFQENADAFGGDHFHTIPEGGKVDLAKLKEIMTEFRSPNFGNETLLEHAMKLKS